MRSPFFHMLIFQYLNLIGSGLRRMLAVWKSACVICTSSPGPQTLQGAGLPNSSRMTVSFGDNISSLTIDIIDISGIEESIFRVDMGNPTDADDGGRLWRLLYGNKVGIGLWGNAPGKT